MSNKKSNVKLQVSYFFIVIFAVILISNFSFLISGCGKGVPKVSVTTTTTPTTSTSTSSTTTSISSTTTTMVLTTVADPTFSPAAADLDASRETISISCSTPGATIYYTIGTTDAGSPTTGSVPSTNAITYEAGHPIVISSSKYIRARALRADLTNSGEINGAFNLFWWLPVGALNAPVHCLFNTDNYIVAGGEFVNASNNANADYAAIYNSTTSTWDALATSFITSNIDATVEAIQGIEGGLLVLGGYFSGHLKYVQGHILKPFVTTPDNVVSAMDYDSSGRILYLGGDFLNIGTLHATREAIFNENLGPASGTFETLGAGFNAYVKTIAYNTSATIFYGGGFTNYTTYTTFWNGSIFTNYSSDALDGIVNIITVSGGGDSYIVGGQFNTIGSTNFHHIAKWNPTLSPPAWTAYDTGFDGAVNAIFETSGSSRSIYAGGNFHTSGDGAKQLMYIARWNWSAWVQLGDGLNGEVKALVSDNSGNVYIGGNFTNSPSGSDYIAKWGKLN